MEIPDRDTLKSICNQKMTKIEMEKRVNFVNVDLNVLSEKMEAKVCIYLFVPLLYQHLCLHRELLRELFLHFYETWYNKK